METPTILVKKKCKLEDIELILEESNRIIDSELEAAAEELWAKKLADAKKTGKLAYDNPHTIRLNEFEETDKGLRYKVSEIPFRIRYALPQVPEMIEMPYDYWSKGMFIGGLTRTSDDLFVFGVKGNHSLSTESLKKKVKIDPIGGALDKPIDDKQNYLQNMLNQEIKEELGLDPDNVFSVTVIGMVISKYSFVGISCYTKLSVDSKEVQQSFKTNSDREFSDIIFVEESGLREFLLETEDYRPLLWDLYSNIKQ